MPKQECVPWRGQFNGCGYRMTRPRKAVLAVMEKTPDHLSAEDIYLAVHDDFRAQS